MSDLNFKYDENMWKYELSINQSFNRNNFKDIRIPEMILDSLAYPRILANALNPSALYGVIWRMLTTFVVMTFSIF